MDCSNSLDVYNCFRIPMMVMIRLTVAVLCYLIHVALESLICLVEHDCDTTVSDNNTFLAAHQAARYDKVDCLRFLVQQGTELDAALSDGRTLAHVVSFL